MKTQTEEKINKKYYINQRRKEHVTFENAEKKL
jgi:hypothetical protein